MVNGMTTIRTTCPTCGEVDLTPTKVMLTYDHSNYVFQCPSCMDIVSKRCDERIIAMLKSAGVASLPKPGDEAVRELRAMANNEHRHPPGPALTLDDAIDFHESIDAELRELFS